MFAKSASQNLLSKFMSCMQVMISNQFSALQLILIYCQKALLPIHLTKKKIKDQHKFIINILIQ